MRETPESYVPLSLVERPLFASLAQAEDATQETKHARFFMLDASQVGRKEPNMPYVRPWVGPFHQIFVASLTRWVDEADPKFSRINTENDICL